MVIPQIIKSLDSNLESHSTNLWLGNVSPQTVAVGSIKWQEYHMAQSANKERAILEIEPFWAKPTLEPPLQWNRWQIMLKLAIMAKEGISIDILLSDPPGKVILPPNLYTRIMLKTAHSRANATETFETIN